MELINNNPIKKIKTQHNNDNSVIDKEQLFFKIIRNRYLFKKILGYLKRDQFALEFYSVIDINWLLKNNYPGVLKDKVKQGHYLITSDGAIPHTNDTTIFYDSFFIIFEYIKSEQDKDFYRSLFNNYPMHFKMETQEQRDRLFEYTIKKGCVGAVICLVEYFGFQVTQEHLDAAILINTNYEEEQKKNFGEWISQQIFIGEEILPLIPTIHYNQDYKNLATTVFKIINYFMHRLQQVPLHLNLKNFFKTCPFDLNLSELFEACLAIDFLFQKGIFNNYNYYNNDLNNNNNNNSGGNYNNNDSDINNNNNSNESIQINNSLIKSEFEIRKWLLEFNDKQLKTKVELLGNKNEKIQALVQMYMTVRCKPHKCLRYYLMFDNASFDINVFPTLGSRIYLSFSFDYGCNVLLRGWFDGGSSNCYDVSEIYVSLYFHYRDREHEVCHLLEYQPFLFRQCVSKDIKEKFIKDVCSDILNPNISKSKKLEPLFFFSLVVDYDDLELVKLAFRYLAPYLKNPLCGSEYRNPYSHFSFNVYRYIRSVPVLTFLYYHLNEEMIRDQSFITSCRLEVWYLYGRLELLKAYEELTNYKGGPDFEFSHSSCPRISFRGFALNRYFIHVVQHIVSKPDLYNFDSLVLDCLKYYPEARKFYTTDLAYLIENTDFEYRPFQISCSIFGSCNPQSSGGNCCFSSTNRIRLFHWILKEKLHDIAIGRCALFAQELNEMKYLTGRIDELIFSNNTVGFVGNPFCKQIFQRIGERGDVKTLSVIMETFFSTLQQSLSLSFTAKTNLYELLKYAAEFGRINIFQFLYKNNYSFVLLPQQQQQQPQQQQHQTQNVQNLIQDNNDNNDNDINNNDINNNDNNIDNNINNNSINNSINNSNQNEGIYGLFSQSLLNVIFAKVIEKDYIELYLLLVNTFNFKISNEQFQFHSGSSISILNNVIVNNNNINNNNNN
ncbi:hypothetical protein DICPUDRAFT_51109 [Dictyostelium purpureum]|uniref:Uncharacterized protein n=1 Tax=Dictyostelium purpureum TaxID=5786 RepID=F1A220_DICPU|nr:uncharacterized protein DICPUDRAFT_51109 [Dictyostelium purpureum]EGC29768.1 hypothetical protein DICPUDRAFT_51109 [Dictyostelium purpureum]|eukprot:XP_003293714.1 hypothetical protein DICPUDRAFT_51109 [Dictyostelium purpureum]